MLNTRTPVGWVLCKFIKINQCNVENGLRRFDPRAGITSLLKQTETNGESGKNLAAMFKKKLSRTEKDILISKAVDAAVHGLMPLIFAKNRPISAAFTEQLILIGQNLPPKITLDVLDLPQSSQGVADGLLQKGKSTRAALAKDLLQKFMHLGSGIYFDGLKQEVTGRK